MNNQKTKEIIWKKRARRTRAVLHGTAQRPRVSVHKTNAYVYVQCIDDDSQKTLVSASTAQADMRTAQGKEKIQAVIDRVALQLKEKGIISAIFDRGAYRFHGVVRSIADGLRSKGIRI